MSLIKTIILGIFFGSIALVQNATAESPSKIPTSDLNIDSVEKIDIEIEHFSLLAEKDPQAALALKFYHQAKSYVEKKAIYLANEKSYKQAIETSPIDEQKLLQQKQNLSKQKSDLFNKFNQEESEIELNRLYSQQKAVITELRQQQSGIMEKISRAKLQPDKIAKTRDDVYQRLDLIRSKLKEAPTKDENKEVTQASRLALQLEHASLQAQLNMLEAHRLSLPAYLSLLETEVSLIKQQIKLEEELEQKMLAKLELLRQQSETKLQDEAERLSKKIISEFSSLKAVLDNNLELNKALNQLNQNFTQADRKLLKENRRHELLEKNLQRLNQQLAIDAPDSLMGEFLYQQREKLGLIINTGREKKDEKHRALQLGQARLSQFKVDDQLQALSDQTEFLKHLLLPLENTEQWLALSSQQKKRLEQELKTLVENKVALLKRLREQYINYIKLINDLEHTEQQVDEKSRLYAELLDEHLWLLPSNKLINIAWFNSIKEQVLWLYSTETWKPALLDSLNSANERLAKTFLAIFLVIILFLFKGRLKHQLISISNRVNKVSKDSYWLTSQAVLITLLLASPWAILIYSDGYLLTKAADSEFSNMVGTVLIKLSLFVFMLEFIRYVLTEKGLAEIHFRWSTGLRFVIRKNLVWFAPAFTLSWFFVSTTHLYFDQKLLNLTELSRLHFLIFLAILLTFLVIVYRVWISDVCTVKHKKTGIFVYYLLLSIITALTIATIIGYYLSAIRILVLLITAFFIIFFLFIIYSLAMRWLRLMRARLSYQQAKERQQAKLEIRDRLRAQAATESEIQEGIQENLNLDEIDIQQVNRQVRRILNGLLAVAILIAMGWHFREVSPVLNTLDDINLWQYQINGEKLGVTSLWDLLISVTVILLTIAGAKNFPGLLEISILNPLGINPGNRYAIARIVQYIIFVVGFVVSLAWLGLAWTDVQWLVTAMSVGLGFGLKEIFSNFFSGLILLFERPIRIGDVVTIGDVSGRVSKIRIRATTITDWDRKELIIPNQSLILENLINWTLSNQTTRITFMLGVAYGTEPEFAQKLIIDTISEHPLVLDDPAPSALFLNFGDSSLDFEIRVFVGDIDNRMKTKHELHIALEKAMRENGIEIPFPQRDIHIQNA